ncbi:DDE transposase family protein [Paenibacillus selenitireducens]|uniref:DDE transposase family protein n=1 Tax=Paenibacillus selenitireducens TaxID=1324314 RepID=A0A1T2X8V5_9BACL|nr:tetratricopeptide repeat protein [Paenibacillus selenitireducens]OPA76319.1 DDE transposase family protein [Paenibacillus selenitireducens]
MKEKKLQPETQRKKIIPIHLDATFFFERAVRSLDRCHYDKALKYFRKAVEYEPENPVNHCNMAGILSEMGKYEESNEILRTVIDSIEPALSECYFYMANNYANMDQFEEAEESLLRYLEEDKSGQYMSEAEEMMDLLQYELDRPTRLTSFKSRDGMAEHDQARAMLEEGRFGEAVKVLEQIVDDQPEFFAARNNLGLAYYYMGLFDKAMETIVDVLDRDPGNLHALCNLAIFYQHAGNLNDLLPLVVALKKTYPFHQEHVFKLATTMGILGQHEAAYTHFRRLLKDEEVNFDPSLYHYTAVAACHIGRLDEAERLWLHAQRLDPNSEIPQFYLSQLQEYRHVGVDTSPEGVEKPMWSYHYHLPFEEQFRLWEKTSGGLPDHLKRDPLVRSSFFWALRHGDQQTKLQVIQALGLIADYEVQEALCAFLLEPEEDDYLKQVAIFVLRSMGYDQPLHVILDGIRTTIEGNDLSARLPAWDDQWQHVLELALRTMNKRYDMLQQYDLQTLWVEFLTRVYPDVPKIHKIEGWAAALEYLTAKMHRRAISYHEVAQRYNTSITTVSKFVKWMDEVCGIKKKMDAIFPSYTKEF